MRLLPVLGCAFILCILSFHGAAQTTPTKDILPRVGTIKDYPATGLMTGCANLYFYPASQSSSANDVYIFLARGDGSNAWMNLGGRDVRLRQVKSLTRENRQLQQYSYRWGALRINVVIEVFKPESASAGEDDPMLKMKITLRKGRARRVVRAVGSSDC